MPRNITALLTLAVIAVVAVIIAKRLPVVKDFI